MKYLFLILISFNSYAGFVAGSKINQCDRTDYISPSVCQEKESETCYKVPNDSGECGIFNFRDLYGGARKSVDECSGQEDCQEKLSSKQCLSKQAAFIDEEYKIVYCMDKVSKEMVTDQTLKAQKDAQKLLKSDHEARIQAELKKMDCGKRVKAVLKIENGKRSLAPAKKKAQADTYKDIAGYLDNGSLDVAKIEIDKIQADGDIVLESDLQAVKAELSACPK